MHPSEIIELTIRAGNHLNRAIEAGQRLLGLDRYRGKRIPAPLAESLLRTVEKLDARWGERNSPELLAIFRYLDLPPAETLKSIPPVECCKQIRDAIGRLHAAATKELAEADADAEQGRSSPEFEKATGKRQPRDGRKTTECFEKLKEAFEEFKESGKGFGPTIRKLADSCGTSTRPAGDAYRKFYKWPPYKEWKSENPGQEWGVTLRSKPSRRSS